MNTNQPNDMKKEQKTAAEQDDAEKIDKARLLIVSRPAFAFWDDTLRRQYIADWSRPTAADRRREGMV